MRRLTASTPLGLGGLDGELSIFVSRQTVYGYQLVSCEGQN